METHADHASSSIVKTVDQCAWECLGDPYIDFSGQGMIVYGTKEHGNESNCNKNGCKCWCLKEVSSGLCDSPYDDTSSNIYKVYIQKDGNHYCFHLYIELFQIIKLGTFIYAVNIGLSWAGVWCPAPWLGLII